MTSESREDIESQIGKDDQAELQAIAEALKFSKAIAELAENYALMAVASMPSGKRKASPASRQNLGVELGGSPGKRPF